MPRDANGNYTLPAGNPVVSGTIIESVWANTTMNDIAAALTGSLSRSGLGGMLGSMKFADGTMGSPGISWTNEPSSGWYREALNTFTFSVGNEDIFTITKDGIELANGKSVLGFSVGIRVDDDEPLTDPVPTNGAQWFESDTGALYMRYESPDDTFTWIRLNGSGVISQSAAPRAEPIASSTTITIDADTTDITMINALGTDTTIEAPTGTPDDGQSLLIRIKDDGVARAITWDAVFVEIDCVLPASTVPGKWMYVGGFYNAISLRWEMVGVNIEA